MNTQVRRESTINRGIYKTSPSSDLTVFQAATLSNEVVDTNLFIN